MATFEFYIWAAKMINAVSIFVKIYHKGACMEHMYVYHRVCVQCTISVQMFHPDLPSVNTVREKKADSSPTELLATQL